MNFNLVAILITILCVSASANPDTLLLLSSERHEQVKNLDQLKIHLADKQQTNVQAFTISHDLQIPLLLEKVKQVLKEKDMSPEQVSSFNILQKIRAQSIIKDKDSIVEQITMAQLGQIIEKLSENSDVESIIIHFDSKDERVLQQTGQTNQSQMFINMTPSTLSGLFVGLFLIIVLMIGISCLYGIKTNDKFSRQNLWVGKQN